MENWVSFLIKILKNRMANLLNNFSKVAIIINEALPAVSVMRSIVYSNIKFYFILKSGF